MERSSFTVADIMSRQPVCVAPEATLRDIMTPDVFGVRLEEGLDALSLCPAWVA